MAHGLWFFGLLALIAFAFGEGAAVAVARAIIIGALIIAGLFAFDIMTHGAISRHL